MAKIFHIMDEFDRDFEGRGYNEKGGKEHMLEKAFKEGCEHGYKKAMRELESYNEKGDKSYYKEDFEEKIARLKEKYK